MFGWKSFSVFFMFVFIFNFGVGQVVNQQDLFLKANDAYKSSDFKKAMGLYKQIPNKSSVVNYNLGNCYYKQKHFGQALLYWRRAEKSWGFADRSELLENIQLLKQTIDENSDKKKSKWSRSFVAKLLIRSNRYFISLIRSLPVISFQMIFLLLWFLVFLFVRFLHRKKNKIIIGFMFSLVLMFGVILGLRYSLDLSRYAIVLHNTDVLSGPSSTFQKVGFIKLGCEAKVKKESGDFLKIELNGQVGWVDKKNIEKI